MPGGAGAHPHVPPFVPLLPTELQDVAKRFSQGGVSHYLTLTLDAAEALLYVGAREAVFAVDTGTVELKAAVRPRGPPPRGCFWRVWGGCLEPPDPLSPSPDLLGSPRG